MVPTLRGHSVVHRFTEQDAEDFFYSTNVFLTIEIVHPLLWSRRGRDSHLHALLAPTVKFIHGAYDIKRDLMATICAMTSSKLAVDASLQKAWRGDRVDANNFISASLWPR